MLHASRDTPGRRSLRHHATAAAFPAAQAFDELGHWGARLNPEANEITLGDDAAVPTAQAGREPDDRPCTYEDLDRLKSEGSMTPEANISALCHEFTNALTEVLAENAVGRWESLS
jgi:hypothetical protein